MKAPGAGKPALSLFEVAAERIAFEDGRALSQVRTELVFGEGEGAPGDGLFEDEDDRA